MSTALLRPPAAKVTWYVINWEYMAIHFTQATVGVELAGIAGLTSGAAPQAAPC